jgi:putative ABC transport system permease protein
MNQQYLDIGNWQLGFAAVLMLVNLSLSAWLRLGLTRNLLVASVRMVVQLLLVGLVLGYVFALDHPLPVVGIGLVMASLAGIAAVNRTRRRFPGIYFDSVLCVFAASYVVTGAALGGIIDVEPWYRAQYAIPLLGMVLGNILNGVSLALDRFMDGVVRDSGLIEADLALGASRWEAAHPLITASLHTGMIPTINSMMVMGIVSLPGMMTGQMLAGTPPASAVRYQIVIMFMIAAATALGAFGVVMSAFRALFNREHQLRRDRLHPAQPAWSAHWKHAAARLSSGARGRG